MALALLPGLFLCPDPKPRIGAGVLYQDSTARIGKTIFFAACYSCHRDSLNNLAPAMSILSTMTPRAVLATLEQGKMRPQALLLSKTERIAVSEWVNSNEKEMCEERMNDRMFVGESPMVDERKVFIHQSRYFLPGRSAMNAAQVFTSNRYLPGSEFSWNIVFRVRLRSQEAVQMQNIVQGKRRISK